jgi:ribosomal protein L37AE/L43A
MSQARLYHTKKSRKVWTCSSCHEEIPVGSPVISFAVGFRGWEQKRCSKPGCYPTPSQRESSLVAGVYSAQESAEPNIESAGCLDDLYSIRDEVADACDEVADEYEGNEMYDINYDLQERAEAVRSAGDELRNWEPDEDEPQEDEDQFQDEKCEECDGTGTTENDEASCTHCDGTGYIGEREDYDDEHDTWLEAAKESLREAISSMELP